MCVIPGTFLPYDVANAQYLPKSIGFYVGKYKDGRDVYVGSGFAKVKLIS